MLLAHLIKKLAEYFPNLAWTLSQDSRVLTIQSPCQEVGSVEIQDDDDELTVFVGNFTHWHVGCYEENFSALDKTEYIATNVAEFLTDLFNDKIVMWGSHSGGGGFYNRDEAPRKSKKGWFGFGEVKDDKNEWVWTGKLGG
jgi:hypothetical protein